MLRGLQVFFVFNTYSIVLMSALQRVVNNYFTEGGQEPKLTAPPPDITILDWNNHYIWMSVSGVAVVSMVSFLAGAMTRDGQRLVMVSAIPTAIVWSITAYIFGISLEFPGHLGMAISAGLMVPTTFWISYYSAKKGADQQYELNDNEATTLGIKNLHWVWLVLPIHLYAVPATNAIIRDLLYAKSIASSWNPLMAPLALIPTVSVVFWCVPLWVLMKILSGAYLSSKHSLLKVAVGLIVILVGYWFAIKIDMFCHWLLQLLDPAVVK